MAAKTRPMVYVVEPGRLEIREVPLPELGAKDVHIRVRAATICGSDLHLFKGKHPAVELPTPVGHELAGEVVAVGPEVKQNRPGDRVAVEPVIACGECIYCLRGQYHLCVDISFQYRRGQGSFTTDFIAPERWVHILPEAASFAEGALLEPLAVALHAQAKSGLQVGDRSLIFGAGAIGLLILQAVRLAGGGETWVVDVNDYRLQMAAHFGATQVWNNLTIDLLQEVIQRTRGLGVDRTFEAIGLQTTLVQALQALRKGGQAVLVGLFEQTAIEIPANIFVQREIGLTGSQGYCWDFQTGIELLAQERIDLQGLITHEYGLEDIQVAFDSLMDRGNRAMKVVVKV
jgi:2-desacetyl-2-hydroxyethyl bacteriochlorophyllide A dehydrogenase